MYNTYIIVLVTVIVIYLILFPPNIKQLFEPRKYSIPEVSKGTIVPVVLERCHIGNEVSDEHYLIARSVEHNRKLKVKISFSFASVCPWAPGTNFDIVSLGEKYQVIDERKG